MLERKAPNSASAFTLMNTHAVSERMLNQFMTVFSGCSALVELRLGGTKKGGGGDVQVAAQPPALNPLISPPPS